MIIRVVTVHQHNYCTNASLKPARALDRAGRPSLYAKLFWLAEGYGIFELYTLPIQDIRAHKISGLL